MPFERFYHYYFAGIEAPITILATSRKSADVIISSKPLPEPYASGVIDGVTNSQPLEGISKMKDGNKTMVWVGKQKSTSGWEELK